MSAPGENPLQARIEAQLKRNGYFTTPKAIPMVTVDSGDLSDKLQAALSPLGGGVAISILTPFGVNPEPNSGAVNLELEVEIAASEIWAINRGAAGMGKPAYEVIRKIIAPWRVDQQGGLHFWNPGPPFGRMEFEDFDEVQVKMGNQGVLMNRALFRVREQLG